MAKSGSRGIAACERASVTRHTVAIRSTAANTRCPSAVKSLLQLPTTLSTLTAVLIVSKPHLQGCPAVASRGQPPHARAAQASKLRQEKALDEQC